MRIAPSEPSVSDRLRCPLPVADQRGAELSVTIGALPLRLIALATI
jgi:hypothetical protein